jgi:hypothetical protein
VSRPRAQAGVRVDFTPAGNPVKHGGAGTAYTHYGCRCGPCTDANTARAHRRALERRDESPPPEAHGKRSTYNNWACRCVPCCEANAAENAADRAT